MLVAKVLKFIENTRFFFSQLINLNLTMINTGKLVGNHMTTLFYNYHPDHPSSTYAKFSENIAFLKALIHTQCEHQRVRNVSFSENSIYVLDG